MAPPPLLLSNECTHFCANHKEDSMGHADLSKTEEAAGSDYARCGVLVFTETIQLRYGDLRARELCEQINRYEHMKPARGVMPLAVMSLAAEIRRLLRTRTTPKDWEQFQLRRVAGNPDRLVLLSGIGLTGTDVRRSTIVIVMQETDSVFWHRRVLDRSKEKFQLTSRETDILQHLLKGWTNKEIAAALGACEQTVKVHMKNLLAKTGIATRTGLVMKAVSCGLQVSCGFQDEITMFPSESPSLLPNHLEMHNDRTCLAG